MQVISLIDKRTDMQKYSEKLEESVKALSTKLKIQSQEFDKLRHKYVKVSSQNKKLYDLNEKLKNALKITQSKLTSARLSKSPAPQQSKRLLDNSSECKACGNDLYMGFAQQPPQNINIKATNSSFAINIGEYGNDESIDNRKRDKKYVKSRSTNKK